MVFDSACAADSSPASKDGSLLTARGNVATRRRARLRSFARQRSTLAALQLFCQLTELSVPFLRKSHLPPSRQCGPRAHRELYPLPSNAGFAVTVFDGILPGEGRLCSALLVNASVKEGTQLAELGQECRSTS